ncbi:MAG: glycosyltransferase family 9 protein [Thermodesulfobacteriota bacterium]
MRILIIKLSSIGDVVQTLPALRALRNALERRGVKGGSDRGTTRGDIKGTRAEIDWLVEKPSASVLRNNPLIDNLFVVSKKGWTRDSRGNIRTARELAARRYDLVLDFQGLFKSALWAVAARGKRVMGFANSRELSTLVLSEKAPAYDPERHAVLRYIDLVQAAMSEGPEGEAAVAEEKDVDFPLYMGEESLDITRELLCDAGLANKASAGSKGGAAEREELPFFIIAPRARWKKKLWDDESFVELGRIITKKYGLEAVIVGSGEDRAAAEMIKKGIGPRAHNLAGKMDLTGLAALMRLAQFCVTLDSGPMHIAVAARLPVVALFGPTAPWRTGPIGSGHVVVRKGLSCSPCFRKKCHDPRCMTEITVAEVLGAVERLGLKLPSSPRQQRMPMGRKN